MAMSTNAPKQSPWLVWGGAAVAAIVVIGALGYWFDWFGSDATATVAPAVEQIAPATE